MAFLNPALLFGLSALAVPVLVLLLFRKKIVLNWAAYEWMLKATQRKHKQNLRDDLLKFLAKLLLLLTLVLLMARPAIRNENAGSSLVVIDITPSMGTVLDGGTRLDRAREMAAAYLNESSAPAAVAVYDGDLVFLSPLSDSPDPRVADLAALTGNNGNIEQFVQRLLALDGLHRTPRIVFFTDAQRGDFQDAALLRRVLEPLAPNHLVIVPVDEREEVSNLGIVQVLPPAEGYLPGRPNVLSVTIQNFSNQPVRGVTVEARVDGRLQDRAGLNLPPNSAQTVDLLVATPPGEPSQIRVELPPDAYPTDDAWLAIASPPPRLRVLSVTPAHGEDPFEYDVFFESALRAFVPSEYLVYQRVRPHQVLSLNLNNFDVVASFGLLFQDNNTVTRPILEHLRQGGALLAFADAREESPFEVFGAESSPLRETPLAPDAERLAGGILDFMAVPGMNPSALRFLKTRTVSTPDARGLLYLEEDAAPLIARLNVGAGQAVLGGFLPYPGHTDIIYNPNFVQAAVRLVKEARAVPGLVGFAGREVERMELPGLDPRRSYSLRVGDQAVRMLDLRQPEGARPYLSGETMPENHFATIHRDEELWRHVAYNVTRADSDVQPVSAGDLRGLLEGLAHVGVGGGTSSGPVRLEFRALMALLLFLAVLFDTYAHLWRRAR